MLIKQQPLVITTLVALLFTTVACGPSLVIQNVDYSQPIESVLTPDSEEMIQDHRFAIKFSIAPLLESEGVSSVDEIRLIRNRAGYYFITANGFNNVYVFEVAENELKINNIIEITEDGLRRPAFNQRETHIELVARGTGETYNLDQTGII